MKSNTSTPNGLDPDFLEWRWAAGLIKKVLEVVWDQWNHRNAVMQKELDKEQREEGQTLNMEIAWEFRIGPSDLPQQTDFFSVQVSRILYKQVLNVKKVAYKCPSSKKTCNTTS